MQLPNYLGFDLLRTKWAQILNPFIANPSLQSSLLKNVFLINGTTVINHKLGRALVGWRIVRKRASANIFDDQDSNQTPSLTLILTSDAGVSVDLEVF